MKQPNWREGKRNVMLSSDSIQTELRDFQSMNDKAFSPEESNDSLRKSVKSM